MVIDVARVVCVGSPTPAFDVAICQQLFVAKQVTLVPLKLP